MSSNYVLLGLGMVVAGPLVDTWGARWLWGGAALAFGLAAVAAVVLSRGVGVAATQVLEEPADTRV